MTSRPAPIRPPVPRADDEEDEEEEKQREISLSLPVVRQLLKSRTVLVCGPVTDEMSRDVMAQLLVLDGENPEKPIRVYINSPGGAVDAGYAIYDVMRYVQAPVHAVCAGLAASAATVILLGADKENRYSLPNTRFLLHQPSSGVQGPASDVIVSAKEILKLREKVNQLLARETGQPMERIVEDTRRDFWMSAQEAKDYGLISGIVESVRDLPS